jgi:hypothetical protein
MAKKAMTTKHLTALGTLLDTGGARAARTKKSEATAKPSRLPNKRVVLFAVAVAALAAPASASALDRPTLAQATRVTEALAAQTSEQVVASMNDAYAVESVSARCRRPVGNAPRFVNCVYALFFVRADSGARATCLNAVRVAKTRSGRIRARAGTPSCTDPELAPRAGSL